MSKKTLLISALVLIGAFYLGFYFNWKGHEISQATITPTSTPLPTPKESTLIFTGDIMLSRSVGDAMAKRNDYTYPFLKIADYLSDADLTIGNLEGPISSRGVKVGSIYSFRADPKVIEGLKSSGFDILSVANNHMWDYGEIAFADTLNYLKTSGINPVGGGMNFLEAHSGVIKNINGTKVGFLAYTNLLPISVSAGENSPGVSYLNNDQMVTDIQTLKSRADVVVVSFHWGDEYKLSHNGLQEQTGKMAIDAGASLVIGHHPHVVEEVERYKNGWIAYSLGNFVFDQNFSEETSRGLVLRVTIKNAEIIGVEKRAVKIINYQPQFP